MTQFWENLPKGAFSFFCVYMMYEESFAEVSPCLDAYLNCIYSPLTIKLLINPHVNALLRHEPLSSVYAKKFRKTSARSMFEI